MQRAEIIAKGKVQKAGYRAKVINIAESLGITGNIENLEDGNVKIIAEGEKEKLDGLIKQIKVKDELINVEELSVKWSEPTNEFTEFTKIVKEGETDERLDTAAVHLKELIKVTKYGIEENKEILKEFHQDTVQRFDKLDNTLDKRFSSLDNSFHSFHQDTVQRFDKLDDSFHSFHQDTIQRFDIVDEKYGKIAENMEKILQEMKEEREKSGKSMEKLINAILKLVEKK
jgi:acylphosphatase